MSSAALTTFTGNAPQDKTQCESFATLHPSKNPLLLGTPGLRSKVARED